MEMENVNGNENENSNGNGNINGSGNGNGEKGNDLVWSMESKENEKVVGVFRKMEKIGNILGIFPLFFIL
jgi:hypothetical protein